MPTLFINGCDMHYSECGDGRPIVLLHGFPMDGRIFQDQLDGLSGEFRVVAPDLRGFGQSRSDEAFTIESLADDVHAFLGQRKLLPCVVGGLSMGGYVAFALLTRHLADFAGFILIDSRCEADGPDARANRDRMIELARAKGASAVADQMEPRLLRPEADPAVRARLREIMEGCPAQTIIHASQAMRDRKDYRDKLPSVAVPALILMGEQDPLVSRDLCGSMAREIPRARMETIPQAAHVPTMENPQATNDAIRRFMHSPP